MKLNNVLIKMLIISIVIFGSVLNISADIIKKGSICLIVGQAVKLESDIVTYGGSFIDHNNKAIHIFIYVRYGFTRSYYITDNEPFEIDDNKVNYIFTRVDNCFNITTIIK